MSNNTNTNTNTNTNIKNKNKNNEHYDFGVSGVLIWSFHMIIGIFFVYVGYAVLLHKRLPPYISVSVIVLGVLAFLYHAHLWYIATQKS